MSRTDVVVLVCSGLLIGGIVLFITTGNKPTGTNERAAGSTVRRGKTLFRNEGCNACHSIDGSTNTGPTLKGLFGSKRTMTDGSTLTADESYVRTAIRYPDRQVVKGYPENMPSYDHLSRQKVDQLITYLKQLPTDEHNGN